MHCVYKPSPLDSSTIYENCATAFIIFIFCIISYWRSKTDAFLLGKLKPCTLLGLTHTERQAANFKGAAWRLGWRFHRLCIGRCRWRLVWADLYPGYACSVLHIGRRALASDWSINGFVMVIYEKIFSRALDRKLLLSFKIISHRQL